MSDSALLCGIHPSILCNAAAQRKLCCVDYLECPSHDLEQLIHVQSHMDVAIPHQFILQDHNLWRLPVPLIFQMLIQVINDAKAHLWLGTMRVHNYHTANLQTNAPVGTKAELSLHCSHVLWCSVMKEDRQGLQP